MKLEVSNFKPISHTNFLQNSLGKELETVKISTISPIREGILGSFESFLALHKGTIVRLPLHNSFNYFVSSSSN